MTRLVARIRLDGAPVEAGDLHALLSTPGDGARFPLYPIVSGRGFALSAPHLAVDREREVWLALDGRLDNRADWTRWLELDDPRSAGLNDADLLLRGFARWGDDAFSRVVGPFVALVIASREPWVRLARDPLGARFLFFRARGAELAVASRTAALLDSGLGPATPDEVSMARLLVGRAPRTGATYFREIEELPPGLVLRWSAESRMTVSRTSLAPASPPGAATAGEYEERFRELLDLAVDCRLPSSGATAVLMSGGLDSTAVAATAATALRARGASPPLTVSWVFPELAGIDESRWIEAANRHSGARSHLVVGDELFPLSGETNWPGPPDSPVLSPYWRLYERALEAAQGGDCPVLLTGEWADQLWSGGREWLRDLMVSGRFAPALTGLARSLGLGLLARRQAHSLRSSVGRLIWPRGRRSRPLPIDWLTPWAQAAIEEPDDDASAPESADPVERRLRKLSSPIDRLFLEAADRQAAALGIEIRRPFRDRRLVELFIGVPARLLYRPGEEKRLLRRALTDRLPAPILRRHQPTSLLPLFERGLAGRGWPLLRTTLEDRQAIWPRFIRSDWLWNRAFGNLGRGDDGIERVVLWQCYRLERWHRSVEERFDPPPQPP